MSGIESSLPGANWYADPQGRAVQRYWNGAAWTPYVIDASGQQRVEHEGEASSGAPTASATGHGVVVQNIIQAPQAPTFAFAPALVQAKSTGTAALLSIVFGPIGLFYASVAGGAILTAITVLTLGMGIIITWPVAIIWSIVAVDNHNKRLTAGYVSPQPIHSAPYSPHAMVPMPSSPYGPVVPSGPTAGPSTYPHP